LLTAAPQLPQLSVPRPGFQAELPPSISGVQVIDAVRLKKKQMRLETAAFPCAVGPNKPGYWALAAFMFTELCQ
jgi:hypothetical protein